MASNPQPPRARLLVVDDEAAQQRALAEILTDEGYEVLGFTDAMAALQALHGQPCDLLLTDLMMPVVDGIALIREARAIDADLVAVLMTAHGSIATAVEAMKCGALDYVLKPFRASALIPVVERALQVRRLRVRNGALQAEVARHVAQLEAVNQELDAFAGRLAHDLRGPLGNMRLILQMVQEDLGGQLTPQLATLVRRGVESGQRAERMIEDMLAFARLGNQPLEFAPVELDEVLRRSLEAVQPRAGERRVDWVLAPLPRVQGHASLLQQVFVNLLDNALKYSGRRDPARIEVGTRRPDDAHVEVFVADNGAGFDPQHTRDLFKPFRRLHLASEFPGEGMGLAHVRRIVERHGGHVAAEGKSGQGAVFRIVLPG